MTLRSKLYFLLLCLTHSMITQEHSARTSDSVSQRDLLWNTISRNMFLLKKLLHGPGYRNQLGNIYWVPKASRTLRRIQRSRRPGVFPQKSWQPRWGFEKTSNESGWQVMAPAWHETSAAWPGSSPGINPLSGKRDYTNCLWNKIKSVKH